MCAFERRAHDIDVADALERVVDTPAGHLDDDLLDRLFVVFRVDAIGRAEGARQIELARIGVDGDDAAGLGQFGALEHCQADTPKAENRHRVTWLHLGSVRDGAQACRHATTQQAYLFGVRIWIDLRE